MLERNFIRGLEIKWMYPGSDESGSRDGSIELQPVTNGSFNYQGMSGDIYDISAPNVRTLGLTIGGNINFNWLKYKPGHTTKVPLSGDTLTGFMSGCPIVTWTEAGTKYMGHVGTDVGREEMNKRVKDGFRGVITRDTLAFNPGGAWTAGEIGPLLGKIQKPAANGKQAINYRHGVLALVTTTGQFYAALMFSRFQSYSCIIGGIKQIQPMNYAALQRELGGNFLG